MKEAIINGNNFVDLSGFYDEVETSLTKGLDWKIGRNLDAFSDLLRGGFGVHDYEEPLKLRWINHEKSSQDLGFEATIRRYEYLLENCPPQNRTHIERLLGRAKRGEGKDLYQLIVELIKEHEHIEFEEL